MRYFIKLKNILSLLLIFILTTACSKSPEEIVKNIYSSADKGDYIQILKYVVPDSIEFTSAEKEKFSELMTQRLGSIPLYSSYAVDSVVPENAGQDMKFTVKTHLNDGISYTEEGLLRRTDKGDWKIALQKSDTDLSSAFSIQDPKVPSRELLRAIRYSYDMVMSDKGVPQHQYRAACYLCNGIVVPEDKNQYFNLVSSAAKQNYVPAVYELGVAYYYGDGTTKDDKKAFEYWEKAANMGYAKAYNKLGEAYGMGTGVPQDFEKAKEWLEKSIAELDDAQSYYQIHYLYNIGAFGKDVDNKEIEYLQKAADKGHEQAKTLLGFAYVMGQYGVKDSEKGLNLISEAAEDGYIPACQMLGMLYTYGEYGISKDPAKAFYFYKKGADYPVNNNSEFVEKESKKECISQVANCYKNGIGTTRDYDLYNEYKNMKP